MFIMGWVQKSKLQGQVDGEIFDVVICHKLDSRKKLVRALTALSGPDSERRLRPLLDAILASALRRRTSGPLVCLSWAMRQVESKAVLGDVGKVAQAAQSERLSLFVLTTAEFCEFEVCFDNWIVPPDRIYSTSDDEEGQLSGSDTEAAAPPPERLAVRRELADAELPEEQRRGGPLHAWLGRRASQRAAAGSHKGPWDTKTAAKVTRLLADRKKAADLQYSRTYDEAKVTNANPEDDFKDHLLREAQRTIYKPLMKVPLHKLKQVEFDDSELPILRLIFSCAPKPDEAVQIRFLDDLARERWRRGLAQALQKQSDTAVRWHRGLHTTSV
mmetsp:Transcript_60438/g.132856  ORF Transcript_60438/g.132856 Transcript_60438/m.132856 type:complete len:330 (-) Transcript_60438:100-1089(-)